MMTLRRTARAALGAALAAALLMPVLRARAVMADQFADATAPVDNPKTPGPDIYAGRNFDLVPDMPDPVAMDVGAPPPPVAAPLPAEEDPFVDPSGVPCPERASVAARGPPSR